MPVVKDITPQMIYQLWKQDAENSGLDIDSVTENTDKSEAMQAVEDIILEEWFKEIYRPFRMEYKELLSCLLNIYQDANLLCNCGIRSFIRTHDMIMISVSRAIFHKKS